MRLAARVSEKEACLVENHHARGSTRIFSLWGSCFGFVNINKLGRNISRDSRLLLGLKECEDSDQGDIWRNMHTSSSRFFPLLLLDPGALLYEGAVGMGSSLGSISMRKSNWSDLAMARAISDRERVRRLLESATMNARAVISAMNTSEAGLKGRLFEVNEIGTYFRMPYRI